MARNRKRAKERRARRPQPVPGRVETDVNRIVPNEIERIEHDVERVVHGIDSLGDEAPDPIAHATPDVELAEAQVALGRPGVAVDAEPEEAEDGDTRAEVAAPAPRAVPGNRLVNFLQGSWRELQRVQWPDRRQVMQATGVVIGFVILAGVFLGVADFLAGKLMNFVLK